MTDRPGVLFLCVRNAGRSQMAAGWMRAVAGDQVIVHSAGSAPADEVHQVAVDAMAEQGIDIAGEKPQTWTDDILAEVDVVVTMGCGDECPYIPGKRYIDWELDDPGELELEAVRPIRDEIEHRVRGLFEELVR